ncbi:MAG TPA: phosphatase PAP2 family protein [Ancylobacter sp.]|uniref:phosphatase PAP2 family protein n=1 Tax=Bradyrhizobium sp. A5 TaxID=3133696 RepID=UPI002F9D0E9D
MNLGTIITWSLTIGAGILALIVGKSQGFNLNIGGFALEGLGLLVLCPLAFALYGVLRPGFALLILPFHAFAQFSAFNVAAWLLQFPLASLNLPAIDQPLIWFDGILGNNWLAHFELINSDPTMCGIVALIYRALLFQVPLACAIVGSLDPRRLRIFILANTLSLSLTLAVATLWPAGGAFVAFFKPPYAVSMAAQFVAVRDGSLRALDPEIITGIIAFPSYHTILAVLIGLSFRGFPRLFPFVAAFEFAIIFSARSMGGHYYADILAGILIACAANWAAERITDRAAGSGIAASRESAIRSAKHGRVDPAPRGTALN